MELFADKKIEKKFILGLLALHAFLMIYLAFRFNGTGDEGDSIFHFLYSKYAFAHPENFLNHWAKPVFVLLTAGIAQFGFTAMKIFNVFMLSATCGLTFLIAKELEIKNAWLAVLAVMAAPMNIHLTLSGLTEPMFTFWLMVGIYAFLKNKNLFAVLWLSFLPFVRSEGLIIFCVVTVFLILKKNWKLIPLLMTGHVVYSIVGFPHYGDFLWVFNKMSYAVLKSSYGQGANFLHYGILMFEVIGFFLMPFLLLALAIGAIRLFRFWFKKAVFSKEELWLIYGIGIAYFLAHSIFWHFGLFNSFGLNRVMICIIPVMALIIVQGINFCILPLSQFSFLQKGTPVIFSIGLIYFNITAINPDRHLELKSIQKTQLDLAEKYAKNYSEHTIYFDAIYPALAFEKDWFDPKRHRMTPQLFTKEPIPDKSIVVWDPWFSPMEKKVELKDLENDPRFKKIDCVPVSLFTGDSRNNKKSCLFEFDSDFGNKRVIIDHNFDQPARYGHLDSLHAVSGKYSKRVFKKSPAWGSRKMYINAFENKPETKIKISFWALLPEDSKAARKNAVTLFRFESRYKVFREKTIPIFTENDSTEKWKFIELTESFPKRKDFEDQVHVYIRNKNDRAILIDDLRIEMID